MKKRSGIWSPGRAWQAISLAALTSLGTFTAISEAASADTISGVSVSRQSFNPTIGQKAGIAFALGQSGTLDVLILDRDGFLVRRLVSGKPAEKGKISLEWDGRDDAGKVVPDEAYSLRMTLSSAGRVTTYLPLATEARDWTIKAKYYDRRSGVLAYALPTACRVHAQAGTARIDKSTMKPTGPVLKTLVNREPRVAGSVIEQWDGYDDSGAIRIPELPNFKIAIAAAALPANSIITFGNKGTSFLAYAAARSGQPLWRPSSNGHRHHHGLTALEDVSPDLKLAPQGASWSPGSRTWSTTSQQLAVGISLAGPSAVLFSRQPAKLHVFVDGDPIRKVTAPTPGMVLHIDLPKTGRPVLIAVNWESEYGPVAAASLRVSVDESGAPRSQAGK